MKEKGSNAIIQIYHAGRMANPEYNGGHRPTSASPIVVPSDHAVTPLEITHDQIEIMIEYFAH